MLGVLLYTRYAVHGRSRSFIEPVEERASELRRDIVQQAEVTVVHLLLRLLPLSHESRHAEDQLFPTTRRQDHKLGYLLCGATYARGVTTHPENYIG